MTGKTHKIIGITAGASYFLSSHTLSYDPSTLSAVIVAAYFGSLIPDFDNSGSDIWQSIPLGNTAAKTIDPFIKHRNISHSLLGTVIFGILVYLLLNSFPVYWGIDSEYVVISFLIAYFFHLLADMFTIEGIPLLYPWKRYFGLPPKPFDGARIITGKWFENLVIFPVVNIFLIVIILSNWSDIKSILLK